MEIADAPSTGAALKLSLDTLIEVEDEHMSVAASGNSAQMFEQPVQMAMNDEPPLLEEAVIRNSEQGIKADSVVGGSRDVAEVAVHMPVPHNIFFAILFA